MKKIVVVLSIIVLLSSCKENDKKVESKTASSESKQSASSSDAEVGADCGGLVFFKKGAVITSENYDAAGVLTSSHQTLIKDVVEENGTLVAKAELTFDLVKNSKSKIDKIEMEYKCDGKNIFNDPKQMMSNFSQLADAEVNSSLLSFPLNPSVGDQLPDGFLEMKMNRGKMKMKNRTTYSDRKVENKEQITTNAGSWSCYKVVTAINTTIDMGSSAMEKQMAEGMNKAAKLGQMIIWYAPSVGFVKTEMYQDGKLLTRSEISSIKM